MALNISSYSPLPNRSITSCMRTGSVLGFSRKFFNPVTLAALMSFVRRARSASENTLRPRSSVAPIASVIVCFACAYPAKTSASSVSNIPIADCTMSSVLKSIAAANADFWSSRWRVINLSLDFATNDALFKSKSAEKDIATTGSTISSIVPLRISFNAESSAVGSSACCAYAFSICAVAVLRICCAYELRVISLIFAPCASICCCARLSGFAPCISTNRSVKTCFS